MKVLAVERVAGCWPEEAASAIAAREVVSPACLPVTLLTDSAIVREGNPVFLPDFADGWMLCVAPYFFDRPSRQGYIPEIRTALCGRFRAGSPVGAYGQ